MLSVLIPTYNYNSFPFVKELHKQLIEEKVDFEIICLDDGSKSILNIKNKKTNSLSFANFEELTTNIGRSAIRNLLAKKATYKWLLFLDADGFPVHDNFIKLYVEKIKEPNNKFSGFIGGRVHKVESEKNLRIKFGIEREEVSEDLRNENPYRYFFTSNILFKKSVFNEIQFNEKLTGYGYEDLVFGNEMRALNHKVFHINNPVYHLQIEDNTVFINKTKQGLNNLLFLKKQNLLKENDVKLLSYFNKINSFGFQKTMIKLKDFFIRKAIETSSLFYYDLFKLSYLCYLKEKQDETK
ncbi:glycosyltransferase family 2 protein [Polaribacter haliotis]|uniref:Glycosyltransferase family 2 protein n=1 Tax=Polaribacter haliotis TaxID=1888915 RepID=A0A7L8AEM2_9FLAO|nr:glycosyltransferase [Polaribacter haliotis]QOD60468.1 glycosyltransferase family 2 protein [Polaribacter haliotis]